MELVTAEEILAFLPNEKPDEKTKEKIDSSLGLAQAQAENYAGISFAEYTSETLPADLKAALIKWTLAEYIANQSNTNFIEGDGNYTDRSTRHRQEAQEILDKYRPPIAL